MTKIDWDEITPELTQIVDKALRGSAASTADFIADSIEAKSQQHFHPDVRAAYLDAAEIARTYARRLAGGRQ